MPISNELQPSAFFSQSTLRLKSRRPSTLIVLALQKDDEVAGWRLKSVVLVQIRPAGKEFLATTWLEGIAEYGTGKTESEAITDLVDSLGEYREFLEKREQSLGDDALNELRRLRQTIERTPES